MWEVVLHSLPVLFDLVRLLLTPASKCKAAVHFCFVGLLLTPAL
jgi:hypothetical protein